MPISRYAIVLLVISLSSCNYKATPIHTSLIKKDYTHRLEAKNTLIAFVGEKISWEPMPYRKGSMYVGFRAKYKIIQMMYGKYRNDTISFEAFDHYGVPSFLHYKNALLYVTRSKRKYYHEAYLFDDVYKTKNGKWAGPYQRSYTPKTPLIKPEKIDFEEQVAFAMSMVCYDGMIRCLDYAYPTPYFRHEGDSAIAEYGNYIEELVLEEKQTSLTERELFGDSTFKERGGIVEEVQLEPIPEEDTARFARFEPYAQKFIDDLLSGNFENISSSLADSLYSCDSLLSRADFITTNGHRLFNSDFIKEVQTGAAKRISDLRIFVPSTKRNLVRFAIGLSFTEEKPNEFKLVSYEDMYDPHCNKEHYDPANGFSNVDYMMMGN
jgi:hypothetical protein